MPLGQQCLFHGRVSFLTSSGKWEGVLPVERETSASPEMEEKNYISVLILAKAL